MEAWQSQQNKLQCSRLRQKHHKYLVFFALFRKKYHLETDSYFKKFLTDLPRWRYILYLNIHSPQINYYIENSSLPYHYFAYFSSPSYPFYICSMWLLYYLGSIISFSYSAFIYYFSPSASPASGSSMSPPASLLILCSSLWYRFCNCCSS